MQNIITIALNDLRIFFSERGNIIGITLVPIFMTIALGIAFGGNLGGGGSQPELIRVDVIDNDESELSADFLNRLRETGANLLLCPMDATEEDSCDLETDSIDVDTSIQRIDNGDTRALIVIPTGFEADFLAFEPISLTYFSDEVLQSGSPIASAVNVLIEQLNSAIVATRIGTHVGSQIGDGFADDEEQDTFSQHVYDTASDLLETNPVVVRYILTEQGEVSTTGVGTGFGQSVPGIGAMQVLFTVLGGMVTLIRERKQWTLQRLMAMPISRAEILGGKILTYFLLGMIQYAIILVVGIFVGVNYGSNIFALLLLVSAFVLCVTALTFTIATRIQNESQANSLSTLLGLLLAPLGGAWWPLAIVPDFMKVIGHASPVAWVMDGFNDLIFYGGGLVDVLPEVGVLLVATAILFVVGIRGFQFSD